MREAGIGRLFLGQTLGQVVPRRKELGTELNGLNPGSWVPASGPSPAQPLHRAQDKGGVGSLASGLNATPTSSQRCGQDLPEADTLQAEGPRGLPGGGGPS